MSSCIIMGKLFVLINGILNNDRLHMINFIYSFGQALTQFLFPFLIQLLTKWICYNCTLLVVGALMFHIVPITLLVVKAKISIRLRQKRSTPTHQAANDESRYSDTTAVSFDFSHEIKYPSDAFDIDSKWNNPSQFSEGSGSKAKGDNFLENLDSHRMMNSEGVEILQTILEDDEEMEIKYPETITIDETELTDEAIESIYQEINRKHEQNHKSESDPRCCRLIKSFLARKFNKFYTTLHRQIVNPLRRSLKIFKFYPSVIIKSCDIFSYLLFITLILPNLALKYPVFEERATVIFLISLMGLCWICYALAVLKFHNRLKQNSIHYFHMVGLLGKFFGYLCECEGVTKAREVYEFPSHFSHKPAIFHERLHIRTHPHKPRPRELVSSARNYDSQLLPSQEVVLRSWLNLQL